MVDKQGTVVAVANDAYRSLIGVDLSHEKWVQMALGTASGDEYIVDDPQRDPHHGNTQVLTYATAVRAGGETHGEVLGALGIYFNWEEQGRSIVEDEPTLSDKDKRRTKVFLLDANHKVIACNDQNLLYTPFPLRNEGRTKGSYYNGDEIVAYAKTIGYEEYDGLGWWGCVVQKLENDEALAEKIEGQFTKKK
jgi:hypothetical protein